MPRRRRSPYSSEETGKGKCVASSYLSLEEADQKDRSRLKAEKAGKTSESLSQTFGHISVKATLDEYGTEELEEVQEN